MPSPAGADRVPVCPGAASQPIAASNRTFRTIAAELSSANGPTPFVALTTFLEAEFPAVHRQLEREVIGGHTLLFRWKGRVSSVEPILLMSHLDVVPGRFLNR